MRISTFLFGFLLLLASCSKKDKISVPAPGITYRDVPYGTAPDSGGSKRSLTMDIDMPAHVIDSASYPLIVLIHGGGFNEGDKKEMASHTSLFADSGYVSVSINYRLGWRAGASRCDGDTLSQYEALYRAVQDAKAALRFLVAKQKDYHIDTSRIFIGGGSAGSTIAMYTTYFTDSLASQLFPALYAHFGSLNGSGNLFNNTCTIKGVLDMWGGIGDSTLITARNAVPMISFHGTADKLSPYDAGREFSCDAFPMAFGSACLSRQLAKYGVPCEVHLKKDAAHAPAAYHAPVTVPLAVQFFNQLKEKQPLASRIIME